MYTVETNNIKAIISKEELMNFLDKKNFNLTNTVLITISDPDYEYIPEERKPIKEEYLDMFDEAISVRFWDVTKSDEDFQIIEDSTIFKLEKFIVKNRDKKFIINCNAGISRSAGIGLLVEYIIGGYEDLYHFKTSYDNIIEKHDRYHPNLVILDRYCTLIGKN